MADSESGFLNTLRALGTFRREHLGDRPSDRALSRLAGTSVSTVGNWMRGTRFPQRLEKVLAVVDGIRSEAARRGIPTATAGRLLDDSCWRAAYDQELARRTQNTRAAVERAQAVSAQRDRLGWPVRNLDDPFAMDVHHAIDAEEDTSDTALPLLPTYIERDHDALLRQAAKQAKEGRSALMTLIGGSSTGKTRACWETLQQLPDTWRLWHPIDPSYPEAVLEGLPRIGPRTVVWLNEVQHYLLTMDPTVGERVAAGLRELLRSLDRGPVLLLATAHPEDWNQLTGAPHDTGDKHPQARALLTRAGRFTRIPDIFICDPQNLLQAAQSDPRVAEADAHAMGGRLTQYLAGVPALLERIDTAPPLAAATLCAAMDLRRLGHSPALPTDLLEATADALVTDEQWNEHAHDAWLENTLTYLSTPCRGVPGPLTLIRQRPGTPSPDQEQYRLSDYLEELGRYARRRYCPAPQFWTAALQHALSHNDRRALARAARDRGRVRIAASILNEYSPAGLFDRSSDYALGEEARTARAEAALTRITKERTPNTPRVLDLLFKMTEARSLQELGEQERADAIWEELAEARFLGACASVGDRHKEAGRRTEAEQWYRKGADSGDPDAMQGLVFLLAEDGLLEEATEWTERIVDVGDIYAYSRLAYRFEEAGDASRAKEYFRKAVDAGLIDCYRDLIRVHWNEGDQDTAKRLYSEAVQAGETSGPMMKAERAGDHATADDLALTAVDHGTVQPLRKLLWHRLQQQDTTLVEVLARKAIDAGEAFIVHGVAQLLSPSEHPQSLKAMQRVFDNADESGSSQPHA
ncbi:tetratricopeptide repeat protein [Streptomyces sp. NEAU-S77]|uniref:tetratricopeptide repeat protein n=1 Tax=Streptomyces sp. NEAU-S77 TaxID=3411033 RepID=UPI003BA28473